MDAQLNPVVEKTLSHLSQQTALSRMLDMGGDHRAYWTVFQQVATQKASKAPDWKTLTFWTLPLPQSDANPSPANTLSASDPQNIIWNTLGLFDLCLIGRVAEHLSLPETRSLYASTLRIARFVLLKLPPRATHPDWPQTTDQIRQHFPQVALTLNDPVSGYLFGVQNEAAFHELIEAYTETEVALQYERAERQKQLATLTQAEASRLNSACSAWHQLQGLAVKPNQQKPPASSSSTRQKAGKIH